MLTLANLPIIPEISQILWYLRGQLAPFHRELKNYRGTMTIGYRIFYYNKYLDISMNTFYVEHN